MEESMSSTELTDAIKADLTRIRRQNEAGDNSEILVWLLDGNLACSQRPLRDHPDFGGHDPLPAEARPLVVDWIEQVKSLGIRSIISLLEETQHDRYYVRGGLGLHPEGLFGYYQSQGFEFRHLPMTDYQKPSESDMEMVWEAFVKMPKPVLVHCSAGIDRTSPVAAYIVSRLELNPKLRGLSSDFMQAFRGGTKTYRKFRPVLKWWIDFIALTDR